VPAVSIVLPTFNRGDVLGRAIDSVRRQTFSDWELLLVDDGSTDGTAERWSGVDPRIVVIRQANAGVYAARNAGLAKARADLITFLDSDDEWYPHYLELTTAFLAHDPAAAYVTTEFWEDWGSGPSERHDLVEVRDKYPRRAATVGSSLFALPPGETDPYMRLYSTREPIGDWARGILQRAGLGDVNLYRGRIFDHLRFGYLNWLPTTMVTRRALEAVGPFATHTRSAADYHFLCRLARAFPANMIAVPCATKHERARDGGRLAQDHLATGQGAYRFALNLLGFFDEIFVAPSNGDPEIALLRRYACLAAGRAALSLGMRAEARAHLRAAASLRPTLWRAYPALAGAWLAPTDRVLGTGYRGVVRIADVAGRVVRGQLTPGRIVRRLFRRGAPAA
jgi:GT2 family glycosyltransferase